MRTTTRIAGAVLGMVLGFTLGGAASASERDTGRDLHRECAELIWERGGRVIDPDGTSRAPASLDELLALPAHCPELGTNRLLHPEG